MKTKKTGIGILMTALMVSLLAGCGGKAEPDENSGLYKAVTAKMAGLEMEIDDIFDDAVTLELQDGGKAVFTYEGKDYKMKWERSGKKLTAKGGGAELSGTVKDGVMELTDILDSGVDITLECKSLVRQASRSDRDRSKKESDDKADKGETGRSADSKTDDGSGDSSGSGSPETTQGEYDFDEALKLVGDYEGIMIFREAAHFYDDSFDGVPVNAYARIVIDENGEPQVFLKHVLIDDYNIRQAKGSFQENGWLAIDGKIGSDNGTLEWSMTIRPPVLNAPMYASAYLTQDYETPLFDLYLMPLHSVWDYSYLDDDITREDFDILTGNMEGDAGNTLEDELQIYQDFLEENAAGTKYTYKNLTKELPDPALLDLWIQ